MPTTHQHVPATSERQVAVVALRCAQSRLLDVAEKIDHAVSGAHPGLPRRGAGAMIRTAADLVAELAGDYAAGTAPVLTWSETGQLVTFRAAYDTIPLRPYLSEQAAKQHCEEDARRDRDGGQTVVLRWHCPQDDPEVQELVADRDGAQEHTGHTVERVLLAFAFDPQHLEEDQ